MSLFLRTCLIILLYPLTIYSQQPAYTILGEEQFRGVQVYDVIQDTNSNFYIATSQGLYFYDFYTYHLIECVDAKTISSFNFVINSEGDIFCHNLNNQVFKVKRGVCELFYEVSNENTSPDMSLSVSDDDNLIVGTKNILVINKAGEKIFEKKLKNNYLSPAFSIKGKGTMFHLSGTDSVITYQKGKFTSHKIKNDPYSNSKIHTLRFFEFKNQHYVIELETKSIYLFDIHTFKLKKQKRNSVFERTKSIRIYFSGQEIWVTGTLPGVSILRNNLSDTNSRLFFEDYFISDVYKDKEGNILLSTFDKGILLIKDIQVSDVIYTFWDDPIVSLCNYSDSAVLLGSSKGKLLLYEKDKLKTIRDSGNKPIESITTNHDNSLFLFDDGGIKMYNKEKGTLFNVNEAALKDAVFVSKEDFYIGTNLGISKAKFKSTNSFDFMHFEKIRARTYFLEYNKKDKLLYAATSDGLYLISEDNSTNKIKYKNEDIYPISLLYVEGRIYASIKNGSIIIIEKEDVKGVLNPTYNGKPIEVNKMLVYQNHIVAITSVGLCKLNLKGEIIENITSIYGLYGKRIIDFTINQNHLWVSHSGGLQHIDLAYIPRKLPVLHVSISSFWVNDAQEKMARNKELESNQRKVQFVLSTPTLRNRENITYHYKLDGYDTGWNKSSYEANKISYNALAPGKYTFLVKVERFGLFSNPVSYTFKIATPFYASWWFILTIILLFILSVYAVFRWQLNSQREKSRRINELNSSKLTAIQSQMNPHFIFNSLNSIQDLILKGDVENSYSYITTFSNLVRRTLNYSERDFIDFDQEIKLIEIYLSLEKLRFKKDFTYTVLTNEIADIQIPPMLIQPFIENALVHGLLHKVGPKELVISFELEENLICTIRDNGIGREAAKAIKKRQKSEHESFSGKAIRNRFEILSKVFNEQFGYEYEDLFENNVLCGTKVTLHIPVKHEF